MADSPMVDNPMEKARTAAWLEYANGTFSKADQRIFEDAFTLGWHALSNHRRNKPSAARDVAVKLAGEFRRRGNYDRH